MWADTVTLRVGEQLVGVRPDTEATAAQIRTVFGSWLDDEASDEHGEPVPWAFSLRLDTARTGRGPKAVPQLRIGGQLLARSRHADDMIHALDHVLGGVLARQDDTRRWVGLRTFTVGDRAVLVDATPPALTADPALTRTGIAELPVWTVAVDGNSVHVPPPLTATAGPAPAGRQFVLAGIVGLDVCNHDAHATGADGPAPADDQALVDHLAEHHPSTSGALLARFAARHPSNGWFHTVEGLVDAGSVHVSTDRADAAEHIRHLLAAEAPAG